MTRIKRTDDQISEEQSRIAIPIQACGVSPLPEKFSAGATSTPTPTNPPARPSIAPVLGRLDIPNHQLSSAM